MTQLAIDFSAPSARSYVTVHCRSLDKRDERTGELFDWSYRVDSRGAVEWAARINAGEQFDPFGDPWGPTFAEVVP